MWSPHISTGEFQPSLLLSVLVHFSRFFFVACYRARLKMVCAMRCTSVRPRAHQAMLNVPASYIERCGNSSRSCWNQMTRQAAAGMRWQAYFKI
jgi:hypothetical protein